MTPRPNLAGYVVLAAFVGVAAWAITRDASASSSSAVWIRAHKNGKPSEYSARYIGEEPLPDYFDMNTSEWVFSDGTRRGAENVTTDVR